LHPRRVVHSLLQIPDLNDKLAIHVAVVRGSSDVLRELLHGGNRVLTRQLVASSQVIGGREGFAMSPPEVVSAALASPQNHTISPAGALQPPPPLSLVVANSPTSVVAIVDPVSSPVLRELLPSRPISSSKPWNCLTQRSIDICRHLIRDTERNWSPDRHSLFLPVDRRAILEVLRVGKRLEQIGTGIYLELWPSVLSFCGRGWFDLNTDKGAKDIQQEGKALKIATTASEIMQSFDEDQEEQVMTSSPLEDDDAIEFTQF